MKPVHEIQSIPTSIVEIFTQLETFLAKLHHLCGKMNQRGADEARSDPNCATPSGSGVQPFLDFNLTSDIFEVFEREILSGLDQKAVQSLISHVQGSILNPNAHRGGRVSRPVASLRGAVAIDASATEDVGEGGITANGSAWLPMEHWKLSLAAPVGLQKHGEARIQLQVDAGDGCDQQKESIHGACRKKVVHSRFQALLRLLEALAWAILDFDVLLIGKPLLPRAISMPVFSSGEYPPSAATAKDNAHVDGVCGRMCRSPGVRAHSVGPRVTPSTVRLSQPGLSRCSAEPGGGTRWRKRRKEWLLVDDESVSVSRTAG
ncbi:hypothetical protein Micbo1qcDRAFT_177572 [Microdochium bolleyi]|uniref:Uncharacterized protein n=1 Tax=Microdochium bolleyi TaxID=196109 RepID=A0A136IVM8_9PEZI|nr:hypothetical protein Micbo1qcDRAFT_177572 [Microdochium bolleyi]